jgi:acetyltransferase-like isoleucine patch superfamily enzyme
MVALKQRIWRLMMAIGIWWMRRKGLQMGKNWALAGFPIFGSEPYLITIGNGVAMAAEVALITHDGGTFVFRKQEKYRKVIKYGRIEIKDNCVIGYRSIILPGVTIGPNSVVAAGSVVSRSIPPGVLAAGNPARPIMSVERYAEWALAGTPEYDEKEYRRDKRGVLTKIAIRGSRTRR